VAAALAWWLEVASLQVGQVLLLLLAAAAATVLVWSALALSLAGTAEWASIQAALALAALDCSVQAAGGGLQASAAALLGLAAASQCGSSITMWQQHLRWSNIYSEPGLGDAAIFLRGIH
jgi:hypothetical protein